MPAAGADDHFKYARTRFRDDVAAAVRQARLMYRRALIDWACGRITEREARDTADVAAAHAVARAIVAATELSWALEEPPPP